MPFAIRFGFLAVAFQLWSIAFAQVRRLQSQKILQNLFGV